MLSLLPNFGRLFQTHWYASCHHSGLSPRGRWTKRAYESNSGSRAPLPSPNGCPVSEWDEILLNTNYDLNTDTSAGTGYFLILLLYGVHLRSEIDPLSVPAQYGDVEEFIQNRRRIRQDATENTKPAQARMAVSMLSTRKLRTQTR
jgi:hypothetical protein